MMKPILDIKEFNEQYMNIVQMTCHHFPDYQHVWKGFRVTIEHVSHQFISFSVWLDDNHAIEAAFMYNDRIKAWTQTMDLCLVQLSKPYYVDFGFLTTPELIKKIYEDIMSLPTMYSMLTWRHQVLEVDIEQVMLDWPPRVQEAYVGCRVAYEIESTT